MIPPPRRPTSEPSPRPGCLFFFKSTFFFHVLDDGISLPQKVSPIKDARRGLTPSPI